MWVLGMTRPCIEWCYWVKLLKQHLHLWQWGSCGRSVCAWALDIQAEALIMCESSMTQFNCLVGACVETQLDGPVSRGEGNAAWETADPWSPSRQLTGWHTLIVELLTIAWCGWGWCCVTLRQARKCALKKKSDPINVVQKSDCALQSQETKS